MSCIVTDKRIDEDLCLNDLAENEAFAFKNSLDTICTKAGNGYNILHIKSDYLVIEKVHNAANSPVRRISLEIIVKNR